MEDHPNTPPTGQAPSMALATVMHNALKLHSSQARLHQANGATMEPVVLSSIFGKQISKLTSTPDTLASFQATTNVRATQNADSTNRDTMEFAIKMAVDSTPLEMATSYSMGQEVTMKLIRRSLSQLLLSLQLLMEPIMETFQK